VDRRDQHRGVELERDDRCDQHGHHGTIRLLDIARAGPPDVDSARGCWLTAIPPWLNADAALSIRRATGEEVLTVFSPNEEWSVYVQPGGAITSAFVGTPSDAIVWVNATARRAERDEDGTYVIRIDAQFSPAARAVS
jgi:hypothetical protein